MTDQMRSDCPPGAAYWHRLGSDARAVAVQITPDNRLAVAAWVGGDPWGMGLVVPQADGGEVHAEIGSFVVARPDGWWAVWPCGAFVKAWRPEVQT